GRTCRLQHLRRCALESVLGSVNGSSIRLVADVVIQRSFRMRLFLAFQRRRVTAGVLFCYFVLLESSHFPGDIGDVAIRFVIDAALETIPRRTIVPSLHIETFQGMPQKRFAVAAFKRGSLEAPVQEHVEADWPKTCAANMRKTRISRICPPFFPGKLTTYVRTGSCWFEAWSDLLPPSRECGRIEPGRISDFETEDAAVSRKLVELVLTDVQQRGYVRHGKCWCPPASESARSRVQFARRVPWVHLNSVLFSV